MTSRRLLLFILALAIGFAWALITYVPALASTSGTTAPSWIAQTEPPPVEQPAGPDSGFSGELFPDPKEDMSSAKADSSAVPPDSTAVAAPDSAAAAQPDSTAAGATFKPKGSALPDTLEFLPAPGSQAGGGAKPGGAAAPKQRVGFLGIHPIAILFGIAALHYFIIKAVSN